MLQAALNGFCFSTIEDLSSAYECVGTTIAKSVIPVLVLVLLIHIGILLAENKTKIKKFYNRIFSRDIVQPMPAVQISTEDDMVTNNSKIEIFASFIKNYKNFLG